MTERRTKELAEKEDGCIVSVGGLVLELTQQRIEDLERKLAESREQAERLAAALGTEALGESLCRAWLRYMDLFKAEPHGTRKQILALCELIEASSGAEESLSAHDARVRAETLRAAVSDVCMGDFYSDTWAYGWMTCYELFKKLADKAERGEWPEGSK